MKEKLLDVVKWGLILIIAGIVFYVVYPRYYFDDDEVTSRANRITGCVEKYDSAAREWQPVD